MKNRRSHPYFDWDYLLGYYPSGYRLFLAIGEGGVGKSYSALKLCANRIRKDPNRKILLVRDAENALAAFSGEDGLKTLEMHFCQPEECLKFEKDDIWLCDKAIKEITDKDGYTYEREIKVPKRHIGSFAALSTFYKQKAIERANMGYDTIFIDEVFLESGQAERIDACRAFYRTLQSTLRTNPDAIVLMAANLVTQSPLWDVFGIKVPEVGSISKNNDKGVICEHIKPNEDWLEMHRKSVAGRLGIGDYKRSNKFIPNIQALHKERGVSFFGKYMRELTNDGTDVVCEMAMEHRGIDSKTGKAFCRNYYYVCSKSTGDIIFEKYADRGIFRTCYARVTTFGYVRKPASFFKPFQDSINRYLFESEQVLKTFEKILK